MHRCLAAKEGARYVLRPGLPILVGFEVSRVFPGCTPTQSPFEVQHGTARPKGTQPLV